MKEIWTKRKNEKRRNRMKEIITRHTGSACQPAFSLNAAGDDLQISVRDLNTGKEEVVFTGKRFSRDEYEKRGGKKNEGDFFKNYKK